MIYVDVSAAVHARAGLGRYAEKLAQALLQADSSHDLRLFFNHARKACPERELAGIAYRRVPLGYKPWRMAILMAHYARLPFNRLVPGATLFHSTEHLLMPLRAVPTVLTVHDLIFRRFPEYHKPLNYWFLNRAMPLFCRQATAIIAVSQASKQDIVTEYGVDPAKIVVIHEAAADHFRPVSTAAVDAAREKYHLPGAYLVHLGTIEPRKNLDRLLDALLKLRQTYPDLELVLVGSKGWLYDDFFARIEAERLQHAVRTPGWIPDEDLPAVIAGAALAVQPSLYEGFGLPLLEHMSCDQVVAASSSGSHPEVGGEAAAYFDPSSVDEMVAVIARLLDSAEERARRRELGQRQAARFSWASTARQTLDLYNSLMQPYAFQSHG